MFLLFPCRNSYQKKKMDLDFAVKTHNTFYSQPLRGGGMLSVPIAAQQTSVHSQPTARHIYKQTMRPVHGRALPNGRSESALIQVLVISSEYNFCKGLVVNKRRPNKQNHTILILPIPQSRKGAQISQFLNFNISQKLVLKLYHFNIERNIPKSSNPLPSCYR